MIRSLLTRLAIPLRLAPVDALLAVVLATFALTLIVGPVMAQSASPGSSQQPAATPTAAVVAPTATPAAAPSASPALASPAPTAAPASQAAPSPAASQPVVAPSPSPAPCPNPTPPPPTPAPSLLPGQTLPPPPTLAPGVTPTPTRHPNLCPAQPNGADPFALLAWIFTPIFQILFMGLALLYDIFGDIGIAIILLTIIIRLLLVPVFRAQIVSQRRMQMLQPELRAISAKYKGNRAKISEEQMKLYKDRGVNPASGCLPGLLQLVLLLPMYQVFSQGLSAPNITSMLQVFGQPVIDVQCYDPTNPFAPCIDPNIPWLAWLPHVPTLSNPNWFYPGGLPANVPEIFINLPLPIFTGLSLLALVSALLQLVQTRMLTTPSDDPQTRSQQRIFLILPLFSLIYGALLPAGLFIYWITTTIFSIVQQYLVVGWGGLFPLFGWTPGFAKNHQPRFPVKSLTPRVETPSASGSTAGGTSAASTRRSTTDSAAGTIRPAKARTSRRGRRR
jgi:YidC/Oxa1 family membrane protein insertase